MVKLITRSMVIICLSLFVCNCQQKSISAEEKKSPDKPLTLKTEKDKISYIIGVNMAASITPIKDEINPEVLKKGFDDKFSNQSLQIAEQEAQTILQAFSQRVQAEQAQKMQAKAGANLAAGRVFLEENAKKEGVITTDSGLQYMVIRKGDGPVPTATDSVKVNYEGATIEGKIFDSSYKRGQPATFPLANVIPGWQEGLKLMPVGSKYKLFIPPGIAYGEQGAGPKIEPNATLVFDVELLDIVKQDEGPPLELSGQAE